MQARCKELGVGYIDLNGTFALIHRDVYIDVVRPATAFKNPQGIKNTRIAPYRSRCKTFSPMRLSNSQ